jgi:hypothetical protein
MSKEDIESVVDKELYILQKVNYIFPLYSHLKEGKAEVRVLRMEKNDVTPTLL